MNNIKKTLKKEKGTTLVEIMLSVALLAIIVTPLLGAVVSSVKNNTAAKDKTEASALAEEVMGEIKAWKVITRTLPEETEVLYTNTGGGNLVPYYEITQDGQGNVIKSGSTPTNPSGDSTFTYSDDIIAANTADFELEINQGTSTSDGEVSVTLKDGAGKPLGTTLTGLQVANKIYELKVTKDVSGVYHCYFGEKETAGISGTFDRKDLNDIKLRITYALNTVPSAAEQLKIFTYVNSNITNNFKVYVINNEETNSGVKFTNKENADFEVIYMDTENLFDYGESINGLYKINVIIKKNTKEIYRTSSYVKK